MPHDTWPPRVTPTQLLAGLTPTERLLGYELLLEAAVAELNGLASDCLRSSRPTDGGRMPSVVAVLDERVLEFWLVGNAVHRGEVRRPG